MKAFTALLGLALVACETPDPTSPGTARAAPPPATPSESWTLKTTIVSMTGHQACSWTDRVGESVDWSLSVTRANNTVQFVYGPTHDEFTYSGPLFENQFFGASPTYQTQFTCGSNPTRVDVSYHGGVSGTFATDGQTLEATETWSYRLASGEVIEMRSRWAGSHLSR